jgi:hypothetical protein
LFNEKDLDDAFSDVNLVCEDEDEEEYINFVPEDKIINQLLQHRPSMNDVEQEFEEERQRRMYNMLRHSSHYKKIQV